MPNANGGLLSPHSGYRVVPPTAMAYVANVHPKVQVRCCALGANWPVSRMVAAAADKASIGGSTERNLGTNL